MPKEKRPVGFWIIIIFLALSVVLLLLGQTSGLFAYDFAVGIGLQESVEEVSAFGVEMNRAFGASDTFVYIPLMVVSLIGLILRKRWALLSTAAVMGISAYWTATMGTVLVFLKGVPGYTLVPGLEYVIFLGAFFLFGVWGIIYLIRRGEKLLQ